MCHCNGEGTPIANGTRYFLGEFGGFIPYATGYNETVIMSEILARGPISCSLCDEIKDFECYDGTYTH